MPETKISFDDLKALLESIFIHVGASENIARILANNCASCERDGARSHGIFRMPGYVSTIKSGWVDPKASPEIEQAASSFLRIDAKNGFAQPCLEAGREKLLEIVKANGIALLAIQNSHHFSALWPDVEPFAENGLLALSMVNSFACTVPYNAKKGVFGTNPIAFAAPRKGATPLIADMATSAMANGDVQIAAREGRSIPENHGIDADGLPTNDPKAVLNGGGLLAFGGYKGSSISMMIELFAAALTGGKFSFEVDWTGYPGAQTPCTGQMIILIDPDCGRSEFFAERASLLASQMAEAGVTRMPGDRRYIQRKISLSEGISLKTEDLENLRRMAEE